MIRPALRTSLTVLVVAVSLLSLGGTGCDGGKGASSASRPLPTYAGRASELFDDTIEPAAVGLDFDKGYSPKADPILRERAQVSDAVMRVRVTTITAKKDGPVATYQIGLKQVERLAGSHSPGDDFTVHLNKASDSFGIMKNFETRLVGYPFVAFVREFVRSDGDKEMHFHLAPDTKEVKAAVNEAVILGEVK